MPSDSLDQHLAGNGNRNGPTPAPNGDGTHRELNPDAA
jgi:hypothetical protein